MIADSLVGDVHPYLSLGYQDIVPVPAEVRSKLNGYHDVGSYQFKTHGPPGNGDLGISGIPYYLLVPFHHPGHNIHDHGLFLESRQKFFQRRFLGADGLDGQEDNTSEKD
jgi:hypothetical protein